MYNLFAARVHERSPPAKKKIWNLERNDGWSDEFRNRRNSKCNNGGIFMKKNARTRRLLSLVAIIFVIVIAGCATDAIDTTAPTVTSTSPVDGATGVAVNANITATFSETMDSATITGTTFTLKQGTTAVTGTVTYSGTTATFNPASDLSNSTTYTATITTGAKDEAGNPSAADETWTFTTLSVGLGPTAVNLGTAGNFAILAKTAISTVPSSAITGDVGLSPAAESLITGFSQIDATGYATSPQVTGFIYAADMTPPTPTNLTTAISDMETAYTDAAGRVTPDFSELGTGEIGGQTLSPGLYNWTSTVTISSDLTISGASNDVWIFQIAGDLTASASVNITLSGGALAKNIFWQVAGAVNMGTNAHFEGIILCSTAITLGTNTSMNGRALAQSAVALDQNTIVEPAS
jgi:hypothetical protein